MSRRKSGVSSNPSLDPVAVGAALEALLRALPEGGLQSTVLGDKDRKRLWNQFQIATDRMNTLSVELDLIALPPIMYNPSDPDTFAESIGNKLLLQEPVPLTELLRRKFYGSGVYAFFYRGAFDAYAPIKGSRTPIYVGKANPTKAKSKRAGMSQGVAKTARDQGTALWSRIREHADSISEVNNLELRDFDCRYLVTASGWQVAAEAHLISHFKPVWNKEMKVLMGLGKHGDFHETRKNQRSFWDTLHPGRKWATIEGNKPNDKSVDEIKRDVAAHYRRHPPQV